MLPVPYKPYGDHTATATPIFVTAVRGFAIMGVEWSTLTMLEPAPAYVKISTFVVAILVLAVLEWRKWLQLRGPWYFPIALCSLLVIYCGICAFAYFTFVEHGPAKRETRLIPTSPAFVPPSPSAKSPLEPPIANPALEQTYSATALQLVGRYTRSGKSLKFVAEFMFDSQGRGENMRGPVRLRFGERIDFIRGESVKLPILSFINTERSAYVKWGAEDAPFGGIENSTIGFNWFTQATIFTVDENATEAKIVAFVLFPRITGREFDMEMQRVTMANAIENRDKPRETLRPMTWGNIIVYPEGALRAMDPIR